MNQYFSYLNEIQHDSEITLEAFAQLVLPKFDGIEFEGENILEIN